MHTKAELQCALKKEKNRGRFIKKPRYIKIEILKYNNLKIIKLYFGIYIQYVGFTNPYKCLIILFYMTNERGR